MFYSDDYILFGNYTLPDHVIDLYWLLYIKETVGYGGNRGIVVFCSMFSDIYQDYTAYQQITRYYGCLDSGL